MKSAVKAELYYLPFILGVKKSFRLHEYDQEWSFAWQGCMFRRCNKKRDKAVCPPRNAGALVAFQDDELGVSSALESLWAFTDFGEVRDRDFGYYPVYFQE